MGWNQVSLWFYTPRWQQHLTPDPSALTFTDEPVQIVSAVPVVAVDAPPVLVEAVVGWLAERGFTPVEWGEGRVFERGHVRATGGPMPDVIAYIGGQADDVTDLYCRFTLAGRTRPDVTAWATFVVELCGRFDLRVTPKGAGPCSAAEFMGAVESNHNYRGFAVRFDW